MAIPWSMQPYPSSTLPYPYPTAVHPNMYRARITADIEAYLVCSVNPDGRLMNRNLYLYVSVLQHDCMAYCFDIRDFTMLSRINNTTCL